MYRSSFCSTALLGSRHLEVLDTYLGSRSASGHIWQAAILVEAGTGEGIIRQIITYLKWSGILGPMSGF